MNEEQFISHLKIEMREIKRINPEIDSDHQAFLYWFLREIFGLDEEDITDCIVDGAEDKGIDGIYITKNNIYIFQARFTENFDRHFPETKLIKTFNGIRWLRDGDLSKVNPILKEKGEEFRDILTTYFPKVNIIFITTSKGPINDNEIQKFLEEMNQLESTYYVDVYDLKRIFHEYRLRLMQQEENEATLTLIGEPHQYEEDNIRTIVGTVNGKELAQLHLKYGYSIYSRNVRYFLGDIKINKEILRTASNVNESRFFWFYNNGIVITCDEFTYRETKPITKIKLKNFQIVNGCQTVNTLAKALEKGILRDDVTLLVKIIEKPDKDFVEKITLYTNSQSAIKMSDFISNEPLQVMFHKQLKELGYFYEHKRGMFNSLYPSRKEKIEKFGQNYSEKVIKIEDAAQAIMAFFNQEPAKAKGSKSLLLVKEQFGGYYEEVFGNIKLAKEILFPWLLLKKISEKRKEIKKHLENLNPPQEILQKDWVLHADLFILSLFYHVYFDKTKLHDENYLESFFNEILNNFEKYYSYIIERVNEKINEKRKDPLYSHTKFFKSEAGIGELKAIFSEKDNKILKFE